MLGVTAALIGRGLGRRGSSDRWSIQRDTLGYMVGHVAPEAAVGGPLARLQTGDSVRIDVERRVLETDRPDDTLGTQPKTTPLMGIMAKYANTASSASEGASTLMAHGG